MQLLDDDAHQKKRAHACELETVSTEGQSRHNVQVGEMEIFAKKL